MKRSDNQAGGFTLVELLVVIVILGILASIVVFAVGNATTRAQAVGCAGEKKELESAVEAYNASRGFEPDAVDDLLMSGVGHYLRQAPDWYDITAGGVVTPNAAGVSKGCLP